MPASKSPPTENEQPTVVFVVPCRDEEDKYPCKALKSDSLDALAAFCEVRFLVRRAEGCRDLLRRGKDLPEGFYSWQHMPPDIQYARKRVEDCRAALTVGFRRGLQTKEHRIVDWKLEHELAIERVTPLVKALARFKESSYRKMDLAQRINFASRLLSKFGLLEQDLGLAYVEARGAADLLKLQKADRRIVIDGAYACFRLDWLASDTNSKAAGTGAELRRHVRTIISVANDLKEYALAEKIDAATVTLPKVIAFTQSALFDQFKGHLIEATILRLQAKAAARSAPPYAAKLSAAGDAPAQHQQGYDAGSERVSQAIQSVTPAASASTFTVAAVLEMAGVSNSTLNKYAKQARVKTPGRGKRNHRYNADDVRVILQAVINTTSDRAMKERCRVALAKL